TGLRLSEALTLQVRHLNLTDGRAYIETTKNGLPRTVHLPPPLVAAMSAHPRGYDRTGKVFRFSKSGRLYTWLENAAGEAKVFIPDGVSFHAFRHSYGAWMRRYGNLDTSGLVASGAWLSHDAARRYEHVDVSEAARASDMFPTINACEKVV
ncbi:MAG: tyrosine-type recombinase/integrase, partial [Alphaproteobacteria bacterium]